MIVILEQDITVFSVQVFSVCDFQVLDEGHLATPATMLRYIALSSFSVPVHLMLTVILRTYAN